jgi:hypothetical protein
MNKIHIFNFDEYAAHIRKWGTDYQIGRLAEMKKYDKTQVLKCSMSEYAILKSKTNEKVTERFVLLVQRPDSDGFSIERGIEFLEDCDLYQELLIDFFGLKDTDQSRNEWLFDALEKEMKDFIRYDREDVILWIRNYCLEDMTAWDNWLEKKGYEKQL